MSLKFKTLLFINFLFLGVHAYSQKGGSIDNLNEILLKVPVVINSAKPNYWETIWIEARVKDSIITSFRSHYIDSSIFEAICEPYFKSVLLGYRFQKFMPETILIPFFIARADYGNTDDIRREILFLKQMASKSNNLSKTKYYINPISKLLGPSSPPKKTRQTAAQAN